VWTTGRQFSFWNSPEGPAYLDAWRNFGEDQAMLLPLRTIPSRVKKCSGDGAGWG
jgi:hypothetical protein